MPKRRALIKHESTESGLSPPPADLLDEVSTIIPEPSEAARKKRKVKTESVEVDFQTPAKVKPQRRTAVKEEIIKQEVEESSASKTKRKAPVSDLDVKPATGIKGKRKTKEEKEAEAMPLLERTVGHKLFIGAHVSSAGGQSCFSVHLDSKMKDNTVLLRNDHTEFPSLQS
jgi:AP endonuclease-1